MRSPLTSGTKRLHFAPVALVTGVAAAALLSMSLTGTLSGFVASITNNTNTAATGALIMQEQNSGATVTCLSTDGAGNGISGNASTCTGINKFGAQTGMIPGGTAVTTSVSIKNVGTIAATTFKLTPGVCTQSNVGGSSGTATDLCSKLNIVITSGTSTPVFSGTLASLVSGGALTLNTPSTPVAVNASTTYNIAVSLDTSAGNTYQGLSASLPLTWSYAS